MFNRRKSNKRDASFSSLTPHSKIQRLEAVNNPSATTTKTTTTTTTTPVAASETSKRFNFHAIEQFFHKLINRKSTASVKGHGRRRSRRPSVVVSVPPQKQPNKQAFSSESPHKLVHVDATCEQIAIAAPSNANDNCQLIFAKDVEKKIDIPHVAQNDSSQPVPAQSTDVHRDGKIEQNVDSTQTVDCAPQEQEKNGNCNDRGGATFHLDELDLHHMPILKLLIGACPELVDKLSRGVGVLEYDLLRGNASSTNAHDDNRDGHSSSTIAADVSQCSHDSGGGEVDSSVIIHSDDDTDDDSESNETFLIHSDSSILYCHSDIANDDDDDNDNDNDRAIAANMLSQIEQSTILKSLIDSYMPEILSQLQSQCRTVATSTHDGPERSTTGSENRTNISSGSVGDASNSSIIIHSDSESDSGGDFWSGPSVMAPEQPNERAACERSDNADNTNRTHHPLESFIDHDGGQDSVNESANQTFLIHGDDTDCLSQDNVQETAAAAVSSSAIASAISSDENDDINMLFLTQASLPALERMDEQLYQKFVADFRYTVDKYELYREYLQNAHTNLQA